MDPLSICLIILVLIMISALFSASETAFSSLNIIRIKQRAKKGDKTAKAVYNISSNYAAVLTTILICNNIVNILATSLISYLFSVKLNFGASGIAYATIIMTVLIIIFGEIFPKILARQNAEIFAMKVSGIMAFLVKVFTPFNTIVLKAEENLKKRKKVKAEPTATESELLEIVQTIEYEGVLNQNERELIESAITFDDKLAKNVMTSNKDVVFIYDDLTEKEIIDIILKYKYSRIPIINRRSKRVIGLLHENDVLESIVKRKKVDLRRMAKEIIYVRRDTKLPKVLEKLQKNKAHMALVVDSYQTKNVYGLITLEDVLEELVGEIYDEYDNLPKNVVEIGHHSFEIDPNIKVNDFYKHYLNKTPPEIKSKTFLGWIKEIKKGNIFEQGEVIVYDNIVMKIADIKDNNILRLDLKILTKEDDI